MSIGRIGVIAVILVSDDQNPAWPVACTIYYVIYYLMHTVLRCCMVLYTASARLQGQYVRGDARKTGVRACFLS